MMILMAIAITMRAEAPEAREPEALIVFAAEEFDMGEAPVGEKLKIDIPFVNGGDAPLVLTSVYSDCSCVRATYSKDEVAPGDTANITVTFNSANRPATKFRKMIRVRSNARNAFKRIYVFGQLQ